MALPFKTDFFFRAEELAYRNLLIPSRRERKIGSDWRNCAKALIGQADRIVLHLFNTVVILR